MQPLPNNSRPFARLGYIFENSQPSANPPDFAGLLIVIVSETSWRRPRESVEDRSQKTDNLKANQTDLHRVQTKIRSFAWATRK
jgi:hypothetical protein